MASVNLDNLSLTFTVRHQRLVTFKEYLLRGLFMQSRNPKIAIEALRNVTLNATRGDRIGIIGHNGAGKSTLLKVLAGIYPPTSGSRKVEGKICSLFDIALGFENEASGWENIKYRAYLLGETPTSLRKKIHSIADFSELGDFLHLPVRYYSAGMLVRLAFSISTAVAPEILLVDEILSAGDQAFQLKARDRMREMIDTASLMFLVSHDLSSIKKLCDRVIWMQQGQIIGMGKPSEIIPLYVGEGGMSDSDDDEESDIKPSTARSAA